ncbi:DMT family transporter [Saxibacter everestensis]|uniref:DMT family transporter n=1 Tax=Saxibacter everestensis TaxID=2909229 RepID=A0ABY8QP44_9MICO|nr:DMT family transporter [Brevibacteriaceae bacterium ZFBP1038]
MMQVGSGDRGVLLAVAAIWGLNFVSATYALESFTPWMLRVVTFLGGALILAVVAAARKISLRLLRPRDALHLAIAGTFSVAGFGALSALALLNTTAGRASVCLYLMPIWVALLSKVVLRENLGRNRTAAVLIGIAGLSVLLVPLLKSGLSYGALAATGAGLSWAIGTVYLKWARVPSHQLTVTIWQLVAGGIVSVIGAILWHESFPTQITMHASWGIAYTTIMGTAVAYLLWFGAIARLPASTAGLGTLLVPVFGMLASIVLLGERPTITDIIGFSLIFVAGLLALPSRARTASAHPSPAPRKTR